jgi:hypothetical protein
MLLVKVSEERSAVADVPVVTAPAVALVAALLVVAVVVSAAAAGPVVVPIVPGAKKSIEMFIIVLFS